MMNAILSSRIDQIRDHLDRDNWHTSLDASDGSLIAQKNYVTRVYDKNGRGGYYERSGPTEVYIDEFGNT